MPSSKHPASALALWLAGACAALAAPPERVVSINLCTDQLALALAAPGQIVSVTRMLQAEDTPLAAEARALPGNSARAEEVYLLAPDLVLAGSFTAPDTLRMLDRLGLTVAVFPPAETLDDIRANITRMGALLGREPAAAEHVARFDARLAALPAPQGPAPLAALYAANGYSAGDATLPGQMVKAAGFTLLAEQLGLPYGGVVPLETLATASPDLLIAARPGAPKSRAEEILAHPVVAALREKTPTDTLHDSDWTCGTPAVLDTVERLAAIRETMQ
ncbi:ABC transporter substrate-binding protein [Vannielia litorea]|uniref:Iron complex transport system substrate-binding protein n=1 Tax=Vannielia litorea TaxID=1217970 RepID=A0A1N6ICD0_9RHOB|nr:ABC transporter substrate-binding protein [Vannielia litorea]SIO29680.1 iron complex transport system substrate-binding protein [Vannielia litorea]